VSNFLTIISLVAPVLTLLLGWRQRFSLLWFYAAAGLLLDNLSQLLKYWHLNHHIPLNVFVLAELICISFYYRRHVFSRSKLFLLFSGALAIGFVIHTLLTDPLVLNFTALGILCTIYIGYGIAGYLSMRGKSEITYLNNSPFFWINTAFFLYATTSCLLFLFATYLKSESWELLLSIWFGFYMIVNILRYIFIGIGLYKTKPGGA